MRSYRLVAESLRRLDALPTFIPGTPGDGSAFAASQPYDCSNAPVAEPPGFLKSDQVESWRRVMTALAGWDAAVLAEPVGHGKSWVALAVAQSLNCRVAVIAPAALRNQWIEVAHHLDLIAPVTSLEMVSRGRLPDPRTRLVVIDEAHRLRHWNTRRVEHLAPWLPGRKTLLVTGTPIVNSPRDLIAILRLAVADDALLLDGIRSLDALADASQPPAALRRLVIRGTASGTSTTLRSRSLEPDLREELRGQRALASIERLRAGSSPTVARLIRHLLLDAAASSDAAWYLTAHRYRGLLLHARDAGGISRSALRQFIGSCPDQTVMWPLMGELGEGERLPIEDLGILDEILSSAQLDDGWMDSVRSLLSDRTPTLCFTRYIATAHALRNHLGDRTAWVTGPAAGVGPHRLDRDIVLAAFGPNRNCWNTMRRVPEHLIMTEVGAEGLNLQGARRVLHLDLPWHAVGKAQRVGRVVRRGQTAASVTEVVRRPPASIAELLGREATVARKGRRANEWLRVISGCAALPDRNPVVQGERVAIVVLRSLKREGSLAFVRYADSWHPVVRDGITSIIAGGRLTVRNSGSRFLPDREPGLRAAIEVATRPSRIARPRLVQAILGAARIASRARDFARLRRLNELLLMASRSHPLGVERWLDTLDTGDLELQSLRARDSAPPPPRVLWCAVLGRTANGERTAIQTGVSALGP